MGLGNGRASACQIAVAFGAASEGMNAVSCEFEQRRKFTDLTRLARIFMIFLWGLSRVQSRAYGDSTIGTPSRHHASCNFSYLVVIFPPLLYAFQEVGERARVGVVVVLLARASVNGRHGGAQRVAETTGVGTYRGNE